MKKLLISEISKLIPLNKQELENLVEAPKDSRLGDYALPCFVLAKYLKKAPAEIAKDLASKIRPSVNIEKVEAIGPYLNFFINVKALAKNTLSVILKEKGRYGFSKSGKGKTVVIEFSSPNIAKPFGIGHLRSTIIGNSIAEIVKSQGYKVIKINYLGDWGTPFGKILAGYQEFGDPKKLKSDPIKHLYKIYVKVSTDEKFESLSREWFKKLEHGDKKALSSWKKFRSLSIKEFEKTYSLLGIKFDVISGESQYSKNLSPIVNELRKKNLLKESEGALIVDLEKYDLGIALIQKLDGTTLYATRDLATAIERQKKYKFDFMFYEVGAEQKLYFKQLFKILELMGSSWAKNCVHVDHGFYLGRDGKKFATRKGNLVFMQDVLEETISLAKKEILKREKVDKNELEKRAHAIALSAILYGDLKNYRSNDMLFDIGRFLSFEGDTGPYLLYGYARAKSILSKAKSKAKPSIPGSLNSKEKELLFSLAEFPDLIKQSYKDLNPSRIAHYAYKISQKFNEFYHLNQVIGSSSESFRISLVNAYAQVLKNSLSLLGIKVLEKM